MDRKVLILEQLLDGDWHISPEVAATQGISLTCASSLLMRYHIQGLVHRVRVREKFNPPRLFRYQITQKGVERYQFLARPKEDKSIDRLTRFFERR